MMEVSVCIKELLLDVVTGKGDAYYFWVMFLYYCSCYSYSDLFERWLISVNVFNRVHVNY